MRTRYQKKIVPSAHLINHKKKKTCLHTFALFTPVGKSTSSVIARGDASNDIMGGTHVFFNLWYVGRVYFLVLWFARWNACKPRLRRKVRFFVFVMFGRYDFFCDKTTRWKIRFFCDDLLCGRYDFFWYAKMIVWRYGFLFFVIWQKIRFFCCDY